MTVMFTFGKQCSALCAEELRGTVLNGEGKKLSIMP
jgi:hypothetical protein